MWTLTGIGSATHFLTVVLSTHVYPTETMAVCMGWDRWPVWGEPVISACDFTEQSSFLAGEQHIFTGAILTKILQWKYSLPTPVHHSVSRKECDWCSFLRQWPFLLCLCSFFNKKNNKNNNVFLYILGSAQTCCYLPLLSQWVGSNPACIQTPELGVRRNDSWAMSVNSSEVGLSTAQPQRPVAESLDNHTSWWQLLWAPGTVQNIPWLGFCSISL